MRIYDLICIFVISYIILEIQNMKDKCFYEVEEISKDLNKIKEYNISDDILKLNDTNWKDWPEKELYNEGMSWKIIPFYGFGKWIETYCNYCPNIFNFLKQVKGLKTASLSKLSGGTKLNPHKGWGNLSNYVIRCHYGIVVPKNECYISVKQKDDSEEEIKYQKQDEWLLFDDSKIHYAHNKSKNDRIVLLIDIKRPDDIKNGTSKVEDTSELKDIIKYFHKK